MARETRALLGSLGVDTQMITEVRACLISLPPALLPIPIGREELGTGIPGTRGAKGTGKRCGRGYGAAVQRERDAASAPPMAARIALSSGSSSRRMVSPLRLSSTS
jgi:hypothetical protein